jgi:hypothetical protein
LTGEFLAADCNLWLPLNFGDDNTGDLSFFLERASSAFPAREAFSGSTFNGFRTEAIMHV